MRKLKKHIKGICQKCGVAPSRSGQRWCKSCHASYVREWRKSHPLNIEQKMKDSARSYAKVYLKRGKITQSPCSICGDLNSEMHHPDYSKPLLIVWVCRKCHLELHHKKKEEVCSKT